MDWFILQAMQYKYSHIYRWIQKLDAFICLLRVKYWRSEVVATRSQSMTIFHDAIDDLIH